MKLKHLATIMGIMAGMSGCLDQHVDASADHQQPTLEISDDRWVELELIAGHVSLSGKVKEIENYILVDWAAGIEYAQIVGRVSPDAGQSLEYLRVVFTSDRIEWVGTNGSNYEVYEYEDDCIEAGHHCDPVVPAEGISGVFESVPGEYIAVVNTHCFATEFDYSYRVAAYIFDMSGGDPVRVSDVMTIDIICEQI